MLGWRIKSRKERQKKGKKPSLKKTTGDTSPTLPPNALHPKPVTPTQAKPVPVSASPDFPIQELESSPCNGRKRRELVVPPLSMTYPSDDDDDDDKTTVVVTHGVSVNDLRSGELVSGSQRSIYRPEKGKKKCQPKLPRRGKKELTSSSSPVPRSSSSSPTAKSTGRLRRKRKWFKIRRIIRPKKKQPLPKQLPRSHSSSESGATNGSDYVKVKNSSESENQDGKK